MARVGRVYGISSPDGILRYVGGWLVAGWALYEAAAAL